MTNKMKNVWVQKHWSLSHRRAGKVQHLGQHPGVSDLRVRMEWGQENPKLKKNISKPCHNQRGERKWGEKITYTQKINF